jgi:hypothetical protein
MPLLPQDRDAIVANSLLITASSGATIIDPPDRLDIYYGIADKGIGVARLDLPELSTPGELAAPPGSEV